MALLQTLTQPLRSKYAADTMDKNELRFSRYGAWDFFQQQTGSAGGILTSDVRSLIKKSFGNTVQVPVLDAENVSILNVRSCTVADSENTSKLVTLTFATFVFGFTMTPAVHYNNDIKYQDDFNRKLDKYLLKLAATLDTSSISALETNKNVFFPAEITAYYPVVANALQVTDAQKNDYYNNLESIMQTMDYYERLHIITSTSGMPLVRRLDNQGSNNGINENFQIEPYTWHSTNRIISGAGVKSTQYVVPDGYVACENRNDPDCVLGSKVGDVKEWDEVMLPVVNLKVGAYYYADCADRSAINTTGSAGLKRSKVEGFEFSSDICWVTAYNSAPATRYSPIVKTEISAT